MDLIYFFNIKIKKVAHCRLGCVVSSGFRYDYTVVAEWVTVINLNSIFIIVYEKQF